MKKKFQEMIEQARKFEAEPFNWQWSPQERVNGKQGTRGGLELFRACIAAVEQYLNDGDGQQCFDASDAMGRDDRTRESGPRGVYGAMHLSTAAWYDSNGRKDDRDRLLRCAAIDLVK